MLGGKYVVHELLFNDDPDQGEEKLIPQHISEILGRNIRLNTDGFWADIFHNSKLSVSAAPILHSIPCVGYVINEAPLPGKMDITSYKPHLLRNKAPMSLLSTLQAGETVTLPDGIVLEPPPRRPGRKVVILGDTFDPSRIIKLGEGADILIHEATNAYLPGIDPTTKEDETERSVEEKTKSRGHSTPQMAGAVACRIRAKKLILNHFSARYRGDDDINEEARQIMDAIGNLAKKTYGSDQVICARDWMSFEVDKPS